MTGCAAPLMVSGESRDHEGLWRMTLFPRNEPDRPKVHRCCGDVGKRLIDVPAAVRCQMVEGQAGSQVA